MKRYDLFNDGKSHTTAVKLATVGTIRLEKSFEYALLVFKRDSNPCVGDSNSHILDILLRANVNHAAILGKFDAIAENIRPYLVQLVVISQDFNGLEIKLKVNVAG